MVVNSDKDKNLVFNGIDGKEYIFTEKEIVDEMADIFYTILGNGLMDRDNGKYTAIYTIDSIFNRVVRDRGLIVSDEVKNKLDSYIYFKDRYSRYKTVTEDYLSIFECRLRSCADNEGYYLVINLAYDEGMKAYYYDVSIYTLEAFKKEYINDLKDLRNNYLYSLNHYDDRSIVDKEGYRDFLWLRKKYSGLSSEELSIIDDEILSTIATRVDTNIRELEGTLNKLVAKASLTNSPITMEMTEKAINDIIQRSRRRFII